MKQFFIGAVSSVAVIMFIAVIWLYSGGMPMGTQGGPLPFEETLAHIALKGAIGSAGQLPSPISADDINLESGAKIYITNCAVCHGSLTGSVSAISLGMFPSPPQLLPPHKGVTDDSVGETFWKVKNGIRLTGMPGFEKSLTETQMWQVSVLLLNANKLPESAKAVLIKKLR